jgi:hypothetical protein
LPNIRRLTPAQLVAALVIAGLIVAGIVLAAFVLDQRENAAVTADDVFAALAQGDMARIVFCLKAKPELANARDKRGQTPLHVAAQKGMADTTRLLVNMGADPTLTNADGKTAAEIARDNGARSVLQILQEKAAEK